MTMHDNACNISYRPPTVLDTKCIYKSGLKCWFCNELCEICLEPTIIGPAYTDSDGKVLRFCSDDCCEVYKRKPELHSQVFSLDDQDNMNRKVPIGHKEYIHLSSCGKRDDVSSSFIMNVSLCEGDGSETFPSQQYYLNYHLRTPRYHWHYEFFVSDDLQALYSISYSGASCDLFEQNDMNNIKKSAVDAVSSVIRKSGCSNVPDFLEKIRLCYMMGSNFATLMIGGDEKDILQTCTATELPMNSTQEPCAEKSGKDGKADVDVLNNDSQQKSVLVVTQSQLLAILNQCSVDQAKAAKMIQESGTGGGARGEGAVLDTPRPSCEVNGEQKQESEESLEQDEEADCQVQ